MQTLDIFLESVEKTFRDPDQAQMAHTQLHELKMTPGTQQRTIQLYLRCLWAEPVMTQSALGSDPSLSHAQPGPTPGCFSPDALHDVIHHMTRSRRTRLRACMCSPANVWPQRVHARLLLTSSARDSVYKSSLVPRDKLA